MEEGRLGEHLTGRGPGSNRQVNRRKRARPFISVCSWLGTQCCYQELLLLPPTVTAALLASFQSRLSILKLLPKINPSIPKLLLVRYSAGVMNPIPNRRKALWWLSGGDIWRKELAVSIRRHWQSEERLGSLRLVLLKWRRMGKYLGGKIGKLSTWCGVKDGMGPWVAVLANKREKCEFSRNRQGQAGITALCEKL